MVAALSTLLVACSAWSGAGSRESLNDAVAAYQQRLHQEVELSRAEGPSSEESLPVAAFKGMLGEIVKAAGTNASLEENTKRKNKMLQLSWTLLQAENGTTAALSLEPDTGCGPQLEKTRSCKAPLTKALKGECSVNIAKELTNTAMLEMTIGLKVLLIHKTARISCPVCGAPCKGSVMGFKYETEMPPCPIVGQFNSMFPIAMLAKAPISFTVNIQALMRRLDGTVALQWKVSLKA